MKSYKLLGLVIGAWAVIFSSTMASVTQITFADLNSLDRETIQFGATTSSASVTLDPTVYLASSSTWSAGVTTSGSGVGVETLRNAPIEAVFSRDAFEVGFFFGNDDFNLTFDVTLNAFDAMGNDIGQVVTQSNANDFVDQFLGLNSSVPIRSIAIDYARPEARGLFLVIDDLTVGFDPPDQPDSNAVPEPTGIAVWGLLWVMVSAVSWKRKRQRAKLS